MADVGRRTTHLGSHCLLVAQGKILLVTPLLRFRKKFKKIGFLFGNEIIEKQ